MPQKILNPQRKIKIKIIEILKFKRLPFSGWIEFQPNLIDSILFLE